MEMKFTTANFEEEVLKSEIPVLVGTFAMGPVAGILIEVVKVLVHLVTMGTVTAGVGDFANFLFEGLKECV